MNISTPQNTNELSAYLKKVWEYPILSAEEEQKLLQHYHNTHCQIAAEKLITSHLRLVVKIAMEAKGYGLPVADLIAEGNIGLLKALHKFDPSKEVRLSTYAMWWIKAAVNDFILKNWSMVPLGTVSAQKKLFFSIRRIKRELDIMENGELDHAQAQAISEKADASIQDVHQINNRLQGRDHSLNAPLAEDTTSQHQDILEDECPTQEEWLADKQQTQLKKKAVGAALKRLEGRDREIVKARYLAEEPLSLKELGQRFGISSERVRQLEVRALETIGGFLKKHMTYRQLCHEPT
ncbi:RNA polymerase factor sigma-32 [Terasakiella sp.]|uniref:RNA polymerase factor sigma-32 n=1 Tax=Terasakiella sp. TaxID=2034861 RepID=UPI003AA7F8F5